jgi:hypothetical protein
MGNDHDDHDAVSLVNLIQDSVVPNAEPIMSCEPALEWLDVRMVSRVHFKPVEAAVEFPLESDRGRLEEVSGISAQQDTIHVSTSA